MRKNKAVFDISYPSNRKGFIYALARRESSADLNQDDLANRKSLRIKNDKGYIGLFQYGTDALIDIGYKTKEGVWTGKNGAVSQEAFRSSREIQIAAINLSIDLWCKRLRVWGFNEYYGKIVKGIEITESGCIAGCHLVGSGGLASFLDMPGNHKINRKTGKRHREFDGNQTHISEYLKLFANYDLETCCKRKIRVKLQDVDGLPVKDKAVKILSSYDGKHLNSKFEVTHKTDTDGELPVIVRHPGAEIILEIDGRESETISQKADQVQPYTITASDMKVSAPLAAKGTPEPKKQDEITQQTQNPASESEDAASKDVNFHLTILEGDTKKPISNVKFTLVYKGTPKQHITNTEGIKENLRAEIGQTIQVCIAGEGKLQPITSFTVTESLRDTVVKVSLPVHTFTIIVVDTKGKAVSNTEFSIFYRQREKSKKTDHEGRLKVKALVGFVYGFGNKGKPLLHLRCLQSVSIRQITVNQTAIQNAQGALGTNSITAVTQVEQQAAFKTIGQVLKDKPLQKQPTTTQKTPSPKQEEKAKPLPQQKKPPRQKNTHTEQGGKPLTVVGREREANSSVRIIFSSSVNEYQRSLVSNKTKEVLESLAKLSGKKQLVITSTIRTPRKQAELMYNPTATYGKYGTEIIKIANAGKRQGESKEVTLGKMVQKILEFQKQNIKVSLHCVSEEAYRKLNVIDLGIKSNGLSSSITQSEFYKCCNQLVGKGLIKKVLYPGNNKGEQAFHLEINQ